MGVLISHLKRRRPGSRFAYREADSGGVGLRAMRLSEHRVRAIRGVAAALCYRAGHRIHQVVNRPRSSLRTVMESQTQSAGNHTARRAVPCQNCVIARWKHGHIANASPPPGKRVQTVFNLANVGHRSVVLTPRTPRSTVLFSGFGNEI